MAQNSSLGLNKDVKFQRKRFKITLSKEIAPYVFLSPVILLFLVFMLYPILQALIYSFQTFEAGQFRFVGLDNYTMLFRDPIFRTALFNTFLILFVQVPVQIGLACIIAVLMNSTFLKFKGFFRVSFFLPVLTALVVYSIVFRIILNTEYGLLNYLIGFLGFEGVMWLNHPIWSRISLMAAITWRWTGYNMVILLAGLQNIPEELYEAASIDGASKLRQFFSITIPMIKPIILFCTILSTIGTLQLFDESYILTRGGPNNATLTVAHYLYSQGFRYFKFGYASAISYVLVMLIGILSYIQFKYIGGKES